MLIESNNIITHPGGVHTCAHEAIVDKPDDGLNSHTHTHTRTREAQGVHDALEQAQARTGGARARQIERIARRAQVSEKAIEEYLVRTARANGLACLKYTNPHESGFPDRLLLFPDCRVLWVEVKSQGEKPRPLQLTRMRQLGAAGHEVAVVDSREAVDALFRELPVVHVVDPTMVKKPMHPMDPRNPNRLHRR